MVRVAGLEPTVSWSQTAARTWCYRWEKLICRSLLLSTWSPAVSFALYPGAPAVVVVKYVVVPKRSRGTGKTPSRGSVCIVTLIAKKVKLFFPARRRSFPICHSERSEAKSKNPYSTPIKFCAALDKESRHSRRGWSLRLRQVFLDRQRLRPRFKRGGRLPTATKHHSSCCRRQRPAQPELTPRRCIAF